jgi:molybdopterin adenylyltransferase
MTRAGSEKRETDAPGAESGCYHCAILIASDRAAKNTRPDETGPLLERRLKELGFPVICRLTTPDERGVIVETLRDWADAQMIPLIITSGGTGLGPRDLTPEATLEVVERRVPGMEEAMRQASLRSTPHAMLSRAVVGTRGRSLIINLPGSPRAALENLEVVQPALVHALELISGRTPDP